MKRYRKMCREYLGDLNPPSALRVFLTDDTVVTDGVGTTYTENFFQSMADKFSSRAQNFVSLQQSFTSSGVNNAIDKTLNDVFRTDDIVNTLGNAINAESKTRDVMGNIIDYLKQGAAIVLKGNKLSLPKIWQASNYSPTFSVSTRLFSPYGSPKAVKEFIIKPLVYLLLLGVPQSEDMVSYGRPFAVTVRSWGTSFLSLAGITSISLQRGGSDSVYNIYKQPLVININIEFSTLVDGMLAFSSMRDEMKIPLYEQLSFQSSDQILSLDSSSQNIDGSLLPTVVPTLGGIIRSLQPVQFSDVNMGYGPQNSTRGDTMIGGNGSLMPGSFGDIFTEGLLAPFNAAYNYATNVAMNEAEFGSTLLNGVTNLISGAAVGISDVTRNLNQSVRKISTIANAVSLGAYSQTDFARTLHKNQIKFNQGSAILNQAAGAMQSINTSIQSMTLDYGSILDIPIG